MKDMLGRGRAVSVEEALALINEHVPHFIPPEKSVCLEEAYGRVLSRDVFSPEDLPGFARSTMDGFAVASADTFGAGEGSPAYLDVFREVPMGEEPGFELKRGEAARISTGGMLPRGADAVLMLEHAQSIDDNMLEAQKAVAPGENVMQRGEDVKEGDILLGKGRRLRPQDVCVLAGLGLTEVSVYRRPRVSILSTGDEIIPPGRPLTPGLVRDSNSYHLAGLVMAEGAVPVKRGILRDDYGIIRDMVERSVDETEMVLISGGSSVGARDMTERVVVDLGRVLFHSVTLKPGKPLLAGVAGDTPVFGLPGHPRAVPVCFDIFVRPVLGRITGVSAEGFEGLKGTVRARLSKSVHSVQGRQEHINVALKYEDGRLWAVPLLGKSGLITAMARADGSVIVPLGKTGIDKGEEVEVRLL
jgi:molybdopterin molybdotransferase